MKQNLCVGGFADCVPTILDLRRRELFVAELLPPMDWCDGSQRTGVGGRILQSVRESSLTVAQNCISGLPDHQHQRLDCGLPFREARPIFWQARYVRRGVMQRYKPPAGRKLDRFIELALPALCHQANSSAPAWVNDK
jgi:hypothetical protein